VNTILRNLTPHPITFSGVIDGGPKMITIDPTNQPCRVETESHTRGMIDGTIPVQCQTYGAVTNLPDPAANVMYVVSGMVLHAMRIKGDTRQDVIAPATGPRDNCLRNANGHVVAVTAFNTL
jgi:hypothetical protein